MPQIEIANKRVVILLENSKVLHIQSKMALILIIQVMDKFSNKNINFCSLHKSMKILL